MPDDTAVDVRTEETPLVTERKPRQAGGAVAAAAALFLVCAATYHFSNAASVAPGSVKKIPTSGAEAKSELPLLSFLFIIIVVAIRLIIDSGSDVSNGGLYIHIVPYAILVHSKDSDNIWGTLVMVGACIALVGTILELLKSKLGLDKKIWDVIAIAPVVLVGLGTIVQQCSNLDLSSMDGIRSALPLICWIACATLVVVKTLLAENFAHTDINWYLIMFAACYSAGGKDAKSAAWVNMCLQIGCVCAFIQVVLNVLDQQKVKFIGPVAYILIWLGMFYETIEAAINGSGNILDQILDALPFWCFAITLGVRAIAAFVDGVTGGNATGNAIGEATNDYSKLLAIYLILMKGAGVTASTGGQDWARKMAQIGCLSGLVAIIIETLVAGFATCSDFKKFVDKLQRVCELLVCLGLLLA